MPTIERTLELAPVACYLAANYKDKKALFGGGSAASANQAKLIFAVNKILKKVYDEDPTREGLQVVADYLFELIQKFAFKAANIVDGGGGGQVTPITPTALNYPLVLTGSDFEVDGITYNNPEIVGVNLMIFVSNFSQEWQFAPAFFQYTATGIEIVFAGFDANNYDQIILDRYYNP